MAGRYGHYDYRLRLQVQDNTVQADTLKYLKGLADSPDFNERERLLVSTCTYWMVEALVEADAPQAEIQAAATNAILEMAYQMQQIAEMADVDLTDIEIPAPVRLLAVSSHAGLREQFISVLARASGRPGAKPKRTKGKPASPVGAHDELETEQAPTRRTEQLTSANRSKAPATSARTKAKTGNYNVDLF